MKKGIKFERELIHMFWQEGFAAVRVAGSGSSTYPSPDIIAGNGKKLFAIEVKMRASLPVYLNGEKIRELVMFSNLIRAEPYVALRLLKPKSKEKWRFFRVDMLEETGKGYRIDERNYALGLEFDELIGKFHQMRF